MDLPSKEILGIIYALIPGFLAAWVFYGLTAHPKKTPFERTIQALIFTLFVQGLTFAVHWCLNLAADAGWHSFGTWTQNVSLVWSVLNAVVIGLVFAFFANTDWFHAAMRTMGVSKRTSFPSEWFSAFNKDKRFVILHLKGERRLHGWPIEFPDQSDTGHFIIAQPTWLLDDNQRAPLHLVERMLVPAKAVEMVEMMKAPEEVFASNDEIKAIESILVKLQDTGDDENGKQSMATRPEQGTDGQPRRKEHDGQAPSANGSEATHVTPAPTKKTLNRKAKNRKGRR